MDAGNDSGKGEGMGNKITAFSAGRLNGNTEVYMKEALWAAQEMGCEVELIRLNECDLKACKGCKKQNCGMIGEEACPLKGDDCWWMINKFLDSDGFMFGAPVWAVAPPGIASVFRDRIMGPKMDISAHQMFGEPKWMNGRSKARPGALISVGGAQTEHWTALGLPTLYTITFSAQIEVVDHLNVTGVADPGAATFYEDKIEEARAVGRHLAYAVLHPDEPNTWMGDPDKGLCPGCHLNLISLNPKTNEICCAVCGHHGQLVIEDGKIVDIKFVENDPDDRLTFAGKATHGAEIGKVMQTEYLPRKEEAIANNKEYAKRSDIIVLPPSKTKKAE